jgi:hypothetical protein
MVSLIIPQGNYSKRGLRENFKTLQKFKEPQDLVEPIPYHPFFISKIVCVIAHISHQPLTIDPWYIRPVIFVTLD